VFCLTGGNVDAGVMLPWMDEASRGTVNFAVDGGIASTTTDDAERGDPSPPNPDRDTEQPAFSGHLSESAGGASAPVGNSIGQNTCVAAASFDVTIVLETPAGRVVRELRLQLPEPPSLEILDPPKWAA
jgi:hypothetical protein